MKGIGPKVTAEELNIYASMACAGWRAKKIANACGTRYGIETDNIRVYNTLYYHGMPMHELRKFKNVDVMEIVK